MIIKKPAHSTTSEIQRRRSGARPGGSIALMVVPGVSVISISCLGQERTLSDHLMRNDLVRIKAINVDFADTQVELRPPALHRYIAVDPRPCPLRPRHARLSCRG